MRIGVDVRGLQSSGNSASRGIGRYIIDILDGFDAYSKEDTLVLFALKGRPLPEGWAERFKVVWIEGLVEFERPLPWKLDQPWPWPWYLRIPKVRTYPQLRDYYGMRLIARMRANFGAAVNREKPDVLHLPTAVDLASYPEADFRVPVVATFLDAIPLVHRDMYYDIWEPFHQRRYDRQLANLRNYDHIVAISEASRQDAIRFASVDPERVSVVYPSVSEAYGVPIDPGPARARYGIPGPFALFCSVPDAHKNPIRIIEAFARVKGSLKPGTRLVFISPLQEPFESKLRNAAEEYGLGKDDYLITGRIPEEDVIALFQAADCLVSPSLLEGFGLPAAQALTAGIPAIVANRGSQPEVVGDAGIAVDPESTEAIAEAIRRVMTDDALRAELARKGLERAPMFRPRHQIDGLRAIYQRVSSKA